MTGCFYDIEIWFFEILAWIWQRILKKILFQEHFYDAASNTGYIAWRNKNSPQEYGVMTPDSPLPQQVDECLKLSLFLNWKSIEFEDSH